MIENNQTNNSSERTYVIKTTLNSILADPNAFPSDAEMVRRLGRPINTPNFSLSYKEHINELVNTYGLDNENECLIIITKRPGRLETLDLSADNDNKAEEYPKLQIKIKSAISVEYFLINFEDWSLLNEELLWGYSDSAPLIDRIKRYSLLNPGYNEVTDRERNIIRRFSQSTVSEESEDLEDDILLGILEHLEDLTERGKALNYSYLVSELLKLTSQLPGEQ